MPHFDQHRSLGRLHKSQSQLQNAAFIRRAPATSKYIFISHPAIIGTREHFSRSRAFRPVLGIRPIAGIVTNRLAFNGLGLKFKFLPSYFGTRLGPIGFPK
jgi:hypothetical protein